MASIRGGPPPKYRATPRRRGSLIPDFLPPRNGALSATTTLALLDWSAEGLTDAASRGGASPHSRRRVILEEAPDQDEGGAAWLHAKSPPPVSGIVHVPV